MRDTKLYTSILNRLQEAYQEQVLDLANADRAALLTYFVDNAGRVRFCFMRDNKEFGWQIPMAKVVGDEAPQMTAIRGASRETGLRINNLRLDTLQIGWSGMYGGDIGNYHLTVYVAEVIDPLKFGNVGGRSVDSEWLLNSQFQMHGMKNQRLIVSACENIVGRIFRYGE